jgi:anaerobic nitric oxide reductase flavorubredoxin
MTPVEISKQIFCIPINDRKTRLFEGLWPIEKEGISYNSYLIRDQQTVLIDLCKDIFQKDYLSMLTNLVDPASISYLVVNHMEPDHSGALRAFREIAPQAVILATQKAVKMLDDFFGITENVRAVADGEEISLGCRKLRFISAPMVHWPEPMLTYETESATLFSCDAFGGYGIPTQGIFDDENAAEMSYFEQESLRYFANIVAAFSKPVLNAGEKLAGLSVKVVAPSHGLVWRSHPEHIIELYLKWSGYSQGLAEKHVALLHGSMYGNTNKMVSPVLEGLKASGVPVVSHDVTTTPVSYILPSLWVSQGIVIGAPTYEGSLFPTMALVLHMAEVKRIFNRHALYFGSYGWGGGATRFLKSQFETLKWQLTDTLEFPGQPSDAHLKEAFEKAKNFGLMIQNR